MRIENDTGLVKDTVFTLDDGEPVHGVCSATLYFAGNDKRVEATLELTTICTSVKIGRFKYTVRHPVTGQLVVVKRIEFMGDSPDLVSQF